MKKLFILIAFLLSISIAFAQPIGPGGIYGGGGQPLDAELTALAGLTSAANAIPYFTGSGTAGTITSSSDIISWLSSADYATARATMGLEIGVNVQAYDADLTTLAGLSPGNNYILGWNGSGTFGAYQNIRLDDSAAQFGSATASKGTRKLVQSSIDNGILLTDTPIVTGNATVTTPSLAAGTYTQVFAETTNTFTGTQTMNGAVTIGDGGDLVKVKFQKTVADGTWSGNTIDLTCHETIAFGQPVVVNSDGEAALANAETPATLLPAIGIAVVGGAAAATCTILTHGVVAETDWNWTPGATIYVDDSGAGVLTATVGDIGAGNGVQVIGIALHADAILVNPSLSVVVLE